MRDRKELFRKALVGLAMCSMFGICGVSARYGVARGQDTNNNNTNSMNGNDTTPPADQPVEPPAPPETPENPNPETPATPAPTAAAPTYGPLMHAFEDLGFGKTMEEWGFNIHGYVEGGYLYDITSPHNSTPPRSARAIRFSSRDRTRMK